MIRKVRVTNRTFEHWIEGKTPEEIMNIVSNHRISLFDDIIDWASIKVLDIDFIEYYKNKSLGPSYFPSIKVWYEEDGKLCWISAKRRYEQLIHKGFAYCPVERFEDGWYFWDETWSNKIGPFKHEQETWIHLEMYCNKLNKGDREMSTKFADLLEEAKAELEEEEREMAKEEIKERLREIKAAEGILAGMKAKFQEMLDHALLYPD